jgi:aminoglycoside phosphotransferase (APT) family kinase protein
VLHPDEVPVDADVARRLVAAQFPEWADLEVRFAGSGTDNTMYRLGEDLAVRLPRTARKGEKVPFEQRWLRHLGPQVPLAMPEPVAEGQPGEGYPFPWTVLTWVEGTPLADDPPLDEAVVVRQLADLGFALRAVDPTGGPEPGPVNNWRGAPVVVAERPFRAALAGLADEVDVGAVERSWDESVAAPAWDGPPVWVHGDLMPGNLLARDGRLVGLLDVGCVAVGDPAADVLAAWTLFGASGRESFRRALDVDEPMWLRSRGWALNVAVQGLGYYRESNPSFSALCERLLAEVLGDAMI